MNYRGRVTAPRAASERRDGACDLCPRGLSETSHKLPGERSTARPGGSLTCWRGWRPP